MAPTLRALSVLSDRDLLAGLACAVGTERRVTAALIAHLAEVDWRRLYAREACSSMRRLRSARGLIRWIDPGVGGAKHRAARAFGRRHPWPHVLPGSLNAPAPVP